MFSEKSWMTCSRHVKTIFSWIRWFSIFYCVHSNIFKLSLCIAPYMTFWIKCKWSTEFCLYKAKWNFIDLSWIFVRTLSVISVRDLMYNKLQICNTQWTFRLKIHLQQWCVTAMKCLLIERNKESNFQMNKYINTKFILSLYSR